MRSHELVKRALASHPPPIWKQIVQASLPKSGWSFSPMTLLPLVSPSPLPPLSLTHIFLCGGISSSPPPCLAHITAF